MSRTPRMKAARLSKVPVFQLLQNLGWNVFSPTEVPTLFLCPIFS